MATRALDLPGDLSRSTGRRCSIVVSYPDAPTYLSGDQTMRSIVSIGSALICALGANAAETPLDAPTESIGLFKNGLAYVTRTAAIDAPGTYVLDRVPTAVHGSFWIESDLNVSVRSTTRLVELPVTDASRDSLQERLSGRTVTVTMHDLVDAPITGTVLVIDRHREELENQGRDRSSTHATATPVWPHWPTMQPPQTASDNFLVLETENGLSYVDVNAIIHLSVVDGAPVTTHRRPALVFTVTEDDFEAMSGGTIQISYLSRGMTWAPTYQVNLRDSTTLSIGMQTVIRNEMDDVEDAELLLISGFPSIEFQHVDSPLSPDARLATFFQQLNQQVRDPRAPASHAVSQVVSNIGSNRNARMDDLIPSGEGPDLHYQSIGRHTIALGDTLMLSVASATASYERAVEWHVQADDDASRRNRWSWFWHQPKPAALQDGDPWETLRFRNPFDVPMTTAPITVVEEGRFLGQQVGSWVSVGEEMLLPITKALRVRVQHDEQEDASRSDTVSPGGFGGDRKRIRRTVLEGTLQLTNQRNEPLDMVIVHTIEGTRVDACDLATVRTFRAGGPTEAGRYEVTWRVALKPGETRSIDYEYTRLRPR